MYEYMNVKAIRRHLRLFVIPLYRYHPPIRPSLSLTHNARRARPKRADKMTGIEQVQTSPTPLAERTVQHLDHAPGHVAFDTVPDGLRIPASGYQTVPAQKRQMLGYRRIANAEEFGKLTDRLLTVDQPAQDQQPVSV